MTQILRPATSRFADFDFRYSVAVGSIVLMEALLYIVVASLFPKVLGGHAETSSAWAILVLTGAAFFTARTLAQSDMTPAKRRLTGALLTVVALQVVARVDLSESLRLWDFGWVVDLGDADSEAWRRFGRMDHLLAAFPLIGVWFLGVRLGVANLEERDLRPFLAIAALVYTVGFIAGDDAGVIGTVRISALVFLGVVLAAVAFRHAGRLNTRQGDDFGRTSLSFLSTLGIMVAVVAVFMLVVTAIIAAVAGAGIAAPVTDALGEAWRGVFTFGYYLFWPFIWLLRQVVDFGAGDPRLFEIPEFAAADGADDGDGSMNSGLNIGRVLVRLFGAIGAIVLFAFLVWLLFRTFIRRAKQADEDRESLWAEARLLDDVLAGLRRMGAGFPTPWRRRGRAKPGIADLYFDLLGDAASRGTSRPPARTPTQFAPRLVDLYASDLPLEISERFVDFRYADRDSSPTDVRRLRDAWRALRRQP